MAGPKAREFTEKEIDQVENLAAIQCTHDEITAVTGISGDYLTNRVELSEAIKRGKEHGKSSLRRAQFRAAHGVPGKPAEYLREKDGSLVRDEKGRPIQISEYEPPVRPNITMQIWLGKQYLQQSDKFSVTGGDGFEFVKE